MPLKMDIHLILVLLNQGIQCVKGVRHYLERDVLVLPKKLPNGELVMVDLLCKAAFMGESPAEQHV